MRRKVRRRKKRKKKGETELLLFFTLLDYVAEINRSRNFELWGENKIIEEGNEEREERANKGGGEEKTRR